MLGSVARGQVLGVLDALADGDGARLMTECERIASYSPDFGGVLDDLAATLHRIQLMQLVPGYRGEGDGEAERALAALADRMQPEDVQLYYQIATTGRRDLALAPDARTGFEMALLRMLAFRPGEAGEPASGERTARPAPAPRPAAAPPRSAPAAVPAPAPPSARPTSAVAPPAAPAAARAPLATDARGLPRWDALIEQAGLRGPLGQLAQNAALRERDGNTLVLALQPAHMHLAVEPMVGQMADRISDTLGERIKLRFVADSQGAAETPAARAASARESAQSAAEQAIEDDPLVQSLKREFGARVVPQSIKPIES
jgi:DNA polymerase-3 subunit gamma/tau